MNSDETIHTLPDFSTVDFSTVDFSLIQGRHPWACSGESGAMKAAIGSYVHVHSC